MGMAIKENLRNQQRVDVSAAITLQTSDGTPVECRIANLSRSGVMITCCRETARQLLPTLVPPAPGQSPEVVARFSVPVTAMQPVTVVAGGHIIHMRRVSRDEYQLGIRFSAFEGNGFKYIDGYVARLLAGH